jgi:hypothetical protein
MADPGDIYIDVRDRDWRVVVRDVARAIGLEQLGLVVVAPFVSRDHLAAMAMEGMLACPANRIAEPLRGWFPTYLAKTAYGLADGMLAERARRSASPVPPQETP